MPWSERVKRSGTQCGRALATPPPPRWLWHAMDHQRGKVVASVFGRRKAEGCITRHALLEPGGLTHASTDRWGASTRPLDAETHPARTRSTQKIARTPLP